jgi:putative DNA primase/helicase
LGRNEKGPYEWLRDAKPDPIGVVPPEVWEFLSQHLSQPAPETPLLTKPRVTNGHPCKYPVRLEDRLIQSALETASAAGRNNAGFWLACQLRDNEYSESETIAVMRVYGSRVSATNMKGDPEAYTEDEIAGTVMSAFNSPPREAWSSPRRVGTSISKITAQLREHPGGESGGAAKVAGEARRSVENSLCQTSEQPDLLRFLNNDHGNAERLIQMFGHRMRYCHAFRKWLIFDGYRWAKDVTGAAWKLAKQAMLEYVSQAIEAKNDAHERFARQSLESKRINSMLESAKCEIFVTPDELDQNPDLLNVANGTIDLQTGLMHPHDPGDYTTKLIDIEFKPEAGCTLFLTTLHRLMGGGPDASESERARADRLVSYLQKAVGYSATGITSEKVVFFLHGSGNNGKTTFLTTVARILGDYAGVVLIDSIMSRQESNNASADLADLHSVRFAMTSESEEGQRLAEGKLKRITQGVDGAKIKACRKYENPFEFVETHKLWMDCNHKPTVRGTDDAIWNRFHLIPFLVTISAEEVDRQLPAKLMAESEGILAWIVAGAVRWFREGLDKPPEVAEAVHEYREEMDQIGRFIKDQCDTGGFFSVKARVLYTAYRARSEEGGEKAITETAFGLKLAEHGFKKRRTNEGNMYEGIALKSSS